MLERALAIWERFLGLNDIRVAATLSRLARIYAAEGKYASAETFLRRSLAIVEQSRGSSSPELLMDLENYASLLRKMDRNPEATEIAARAEAIRAEHPASLPKRAAGTE
jgi:tetratricopeptide (TPR) repeat protein